MLDFRLLRAFRTRRQRDRQCGIVGGGQARELIARARADGGIYARDVWQLRQLLSRRLGGLLGLLQRGTRPQRQRHLRLLIIIWRHERRWQMRGQDQRPHEEQNRIDGGLPPVRQHPAHQTQIGAQPARILPVFPSLARCQHVGGHHGREHPRHHQRRKHRNGGRPAELLEETPDKACHEGRGQEHGNEREGGGNHRQTNLVGSFHGRLVGRLAHFQVPFDVLDLHDRIIDQHADHQRQRQQGNTVEREIKQVHAHEGRQHRHGQRHGCQEGGTPVSQEEPDHDDGQQGPLIEGVHRVVEALLRRRGQIHRFGQLQIRTVLLQLLRHLAHAPPHVHFAFATTAADLEAHDLLAIQPGRGGRLLDGVGDGTEIAQHEPSAIAAGDLHLLQLLGRLHARQHPRGLLAPGDVGMATGTLDLVVAQLLGNGSHRQPQRPQPGRIQIDMHLACHAAHARHLAHALQTQQHAVEVIVHKPGQFLDVHPVGLDGIGQHRLAGQLHLVHHRFRQRAGQVGTHALHLGAHLVQRLLDGLVHLELHHQGDGPVTQRGRHVTYALQVHQRVLDLSRHVVFQLVGRGPVQ